MQKKRRVLENIFGSSQKSGEEYLFHCPKCNHHKKKLSINISKNCWKCWICEFRGFKLHRLVRKYGTVLDKEEWKNLDDDFEIPNDLKEYFESYYETKEFVEPRVELPAEFKTLTKPTNDPEYITAKNYLFSRGLDDYDILYWKMGYCASGEYGGRIIVPSFNEQGDVNFFVGRAYRNSLNTKYWNPKIDRTKIVFNHLYIDWEEDLTIVEGVFDAIKAGNAIPLLGSTLRVQHRIFREIVKNDTPIYLALDKDAIRKMHTIIEKLLSYEVEVYRIDVGQIETDVGDLSKEKFKDLKNGAKLMTTTSLLQEKLGLVK